MTTPDDTTEGKIRAGEENRTPVCSLGSVIPKSGLCHKDCATAEKLHTLADRFWDRVKKAEADQCWPWTGSVDKDGYGLVKIDGKKWRTHRLALFLTHGSAVLELHALHTCDNPICCNPDHLRPATHQENMADRDAKGRQASGERNGRAKLTAEIVRAIRAAYVPYKVSTSKLAAQFGVNIYVVRDIINRVTWKNVEQEAA